MSHSFFQPTRKIPIHWTKTKNNYNLLYTETTKTSYCMFVCYARDYRSQENGGGRGGGEGKEKEGLWNPTERTDILV